jgi:hypothetical protein
MGFREKSGIVTEKYAAKLKQKGVVVMQARTSLESISPSSFLRYRMPILQR